VGFGIRREEEAIVVEGPVTFATAPTLFAAAIEAMARDDREVRVDLTRVTEADSAAVSLLIHWWREARRRGLAFAVLHPPKSVADLARVYGVDRLLGLPGSDA
jgi:phospholipid transport system transporter-binding protein